MQLEPGQRVKVLVPAYPASSFGKGDDPDIVDPRYWGKEGVVLSLEGEGMYSVHIVDVQFDPCTTDSFWPEELEALDLCKKKEERIRIRVRG